MSDQNEFVTATTYAVDDCGRTPIPPDETRIVGDHVAKPYSWPWQAEMCMTSSFGGDCALRCGGSLIDENWIMCAAHCVYGYVNSPERFHMKLGTYNYYSVNETGEIVTNISQIIIHPQYQTPKEYSHDMSLLRLATPVKFTDHIQPVCLPKNVDDLMVEGKTCFVTGWGATSEGGPVSSQLRQVVVPFLNILHCMQEYPDQIDDTMICAGRAGVDSCQGDSGGPLVTKHADNGRWYQAGIVSWGQGCAEEGHAGVYARVSSMCDFVKASVGYDGQSSPFVARILITTTTGAPRAPAIHRWQFNPARPPTPTVDACPAGPTSPAACTASHALTWRAPRPHPVYHPV
uniref:Peptidase S1 domain-containing protein n=1 Tax=Plectus sambesii TaxID=2011161 RepID=A0A914VHZ7_9BILA